MARLALLGRALSGRGHPADHLLRTTAYSTQTWTSRHRSPEVGSVGSFLEPVHGRLLTPGYINRRIFTRSAVTWDKGTMGSRDAFRSLHELDFDNYTVNELPIDPSDDPEPRQAKGVYTRVPNPPPLARPILVAASSGALKLLGVDPDEVSPESLAEYFSGSKPLPGAQPHGHCYCGHQYGQFSGQLGDGANMYMGDVRGPGGQHWQLALKGAGRTLFARAGTDGRKVLRSSIREFLCSEAMFYLGVPTNRAATVVTGDATVSRDEWYSGVSVAEPVAVVSRLASAFLRFGSLETVKTADPVTGKSGPNAGDLDLLRTVLDFTLRHDLSEVIGQREPGSADLYLSLYQEVVKKTAETVAHWQAIGFCHGVLGTDNLSLLGLTIDYGPFAFMETYDPDFLCNKSDVWGRHSYRNQPRACHAGLERLGEMFQLVGPTAADIHHVLGTFQGEFDRAYREHMRKKLGLKTWRKEDGELLDALLDTMQHSGSDFTKTFRALSDLDLPGGSGYDQSLSDFVTTIQTSSASVEQIKKIYEEKTYTGDEFMKKGLWIFQTNPELFPPQRKAMEKAVDAYNQRPIVQRVKTLTVESLRSESSNAWASWLQKYGQRSTQDWDRSSPADMASRRDLMHKANPRFVMKNYILQEAISKAYEGDYSMTRNLLRLVEDPYKERARQVNGDDDQASVAGILALYDKAPGDHVVDFTIT